jgi:hypothetical protein
MKIYLAGSARNAQMFHRVRRELVEAGHEVHDWTTGPAAYSWEQVGVEDTDACSIKEMKAAAVHRDLQLGLDADTQAMDDADAFVLLLPAGADAHMEFGMQIARRELGQAGSVYLLSPSRHFRASQYYAMANGVFGSVEELLDELDEECVE